MSTKQLRTFYRDSGRRMFDRPPSSSACTISYNKEPWPGKLRAEFSAALGRHHRWQPGPALGADDGDAKRHHRLPWPVSNNPFAKAQIQREAGRFCNLDLAPGSWCDAAPPPPPFSPEVVTLRGRKGLHLRLRDGASPLWQQRRLPGLSGWPPPRPCNINWTTGNRSTPDRRW